MTVYILYETLVIWKDLPEVSLVVENGAGAYEPLAM